MFHFDLGHKTRLTFTKLASIPSITFYVDKVNKCDYASMILEKADLDIKEIDQINFGEICIYLSPYLSEMAADPDRTRIFLFFLDFIRRCGPGRIGSGCDFAVFFQTYWQRWSRGHKARGQGQGHKKIRGQGQGQLFRGQNL